MGVHGTSELLWLWTIIRGNALWWWSTLSAPDNCKVFAINLPSETEVGVINPMRRSSPTKGSHMGRANLLCSGIDKKRPHQSLPAPPPSQMSAIGSLLGPRHFAQMSGLAGYVVVFAGTVEKWVGSKPRPQDLNISFHWEWICRPAQLWQEECRKHLGEGKLEMCCSAVIS